ncbi:MAG: hypothetical protein NTZ78_12080 [Candidatus Aureabacteria bacterium]|nr:hypothetical protein [Candidatus Auribacterota bacterium]
MRTTLVAVLSVMVASSLCGIAVAGSLDALGAPSAGSGMYSLQQVYDYLYAGTMPTIPGSFQEPGASPGSTMRTTKQIIEVVATPFAECPATAANVQSGVKFFCTHAGSWGVQTGTLVVPPTPTITPTPTPTPWMLNEANCNATSGWHWYTTNTRSACWSKTLADSVSWSKGVGNDSDNPGAYTCATGYTLEDRMVAAAAGEWYKIVSLVDTTSITSAQNGSGGYAFISALAITDCVDGSRDLCTDNGCLGSSWSGINTSLRTWAGAAGKSALPYLGDDAGTINDYAVACGQNSGYDIPLGGTCTNNFWANHTVCGNTDANNCWAAACGMPSNDGWTTDGRLLGYTSCAAQYSNSTSDDRADKAFRVVVRP